jgi:hypothetical protein
MSCTHIDYHGSQAAYFIGTHSLHWELQRCSLYFAPACIDTTVSYISKAATGKPDELTEKIYDTMMATVLSFPLPPSSPQRAQQQPDDYEHVMGRTVFYDEPLLRELVASFDEESRLLLKGAADRERAHLPLFPSYLNLPQEILAPSETIWQLNLCS